MNQGYVLLNKSDKKNVYSCLSHESTPGFMHLAPGLPQRHAVWEPTAQPTLTSVFWHTMHWAAFLGIRNYGGHKPLDWHSANVISHLTSLTCQTSWAAHGRSGRILSLPFQHQVKLIFPVADEFSLSFWVVRCSKGSSPWNFFLALGQAAQPGGTSLPLFFWGRN